MKNKIKLPVKELRNNRLFIPVTDKEKKKIKKICAENETSIAGLIRFSLKQVIEM